ncbi:hypothetical protein SBY92_002531 [Candida maltosa Xu316]
MIVFMMKEKNSKMSYIIPMQSVNGKKGMHLMKTESLSLFEDPLMYPKNIVTRQMLDTREEC